jgi:transcriptional repressor NrdR
MKCPFCNKRNSKVVDSRKSQTGAEIRRRRECLDCYRRFTTYERIERTPYTVVKRGGEHETFNRDKILSGLLKSCKNRPVVRHQLEQLADAIEGQLLAIPERQITSEEIGQFLMEKLKIIDKIAYIRFASICLELNSAHDVVQKIEYLLKLEK